MKEHFFVTGVFRSGTTFLARALNSHEHMVVLSDPHREFFRFLRNLYFTQQNPDFDPQQPLSDYFLEDQKVIQSFHKEFLSINLNEEDIENIKRRVIKGAFEFSPLISNNIHELKPNSALGVYNQLIQLGAANYPKENQELIGTKEVWTDEFMAPLMASGRKCIHIIRDPRAIIASNRVSKSGAYPILFLIRQWRKSVAYHFLNKSNPNYIFLRYEKIIADPEGIFKEICTHLKVDFSSDLLDSSNYKDGSGNSWKQNSSHGTSSKINSLFVDKWKDILSTQELKFIEAFCRPEMKCLGYKPSGSTVMPLESDLYNEQYENIAGWIERLDYFLDKDKLASEQQRIDFLMTDGISNQEIEKYFITLEAYQALKEWV